MNEAYDRHREAFGLPITGLKVLKLKVRKIVDTTLDCHFSRIGHFVHPKKKRLYPVATPLEAPSVPVKEADMHEALAALKCPWDSEK